MPTKIQNRFRYFIVEAVALLFLVLLSIFLFTKLSNDKQREAANLTQSPSPTIENLPAVEPTSSVIILKISSPEKSSSYNIPVNKSLSVIDVMKIAEEQGMILKTKDYGTPLGMLVEAINNISNDSKEQKYWTLYINDKMSVTGASSTIVNPGETVTWKFENTTL